MTTSEVQVILIYVDSIFANLPIHSNVFSPQVNARGASVVIRRRARVRKTESLGMHLPREVRRGGPLPSYFSCHPVKRNLGHDLFSAMVLHFRAFCW